MTYDQWKTRDPNDRGYYDYEDEDPCDHEGAEIDILTGNWDCYRCGEHRGATQAEIDAELQFQREYAEHQEREYRREFWRKLTLPIRWPIFRLLERVWPRKSLTVLTDEEIPF